jgi:hypothetical protein
MLQACRSPDMDMSVQIEQYFVDETFKAMDREEVKEIERLKSEQISEVRSLMDELEVRNVVMFRTNFMGTWTCEFPCVICMRFFFRFNLRFS